MCDRRESGRRFNMSCSVSPSPAEQRPRHCVQRWEVILFNSFWQTSTVEWSDFWQIKLPTGQTWGKQNMTENTLSPLKFRLLFTLQSLLAGRLTSLQSAAARWRSQCVFSHFKSFLTISGGVLQSGFYFKDVYSSLFFLPPFCQQQSCLVQGLLHLCTE